MFTGIVEATGEILAVDETSEGRRVRIGAPFASSLTHGQSISVDGACLTVEDSDESSFEAFLSTETLERTTLGDRGRGDRVNLERALAADGRFDGHVVQGHVDATTTIEAIEPVGDDWTYEFALGGDWADYVVEKGSIALDGVSLTVASLESDSFTVAIVPTTYEETTLSARTAGDAVNVEVDVLAKYVERLC